MDHPRDDLVFLVRMWHETDCTGDGAWRGSVHEIATGRKFYVTDPVEITDFIATTISGKMSES